MIHYDTNATGFLALVAIVVALIVVYGTYVLTLYIRGRGEEVSNLGDSIGFFTFVFWFIAIGFVLMRGVGWTVLHVAEALGFIHVPQ